MCQRNLKDGKNKKHFLNMYCVSSIVKDEEYINMSRTWSLTWTQKIHVQVIGDKYKHVILSRVEYNNIKAIRNLLGRGHLIY